MRQHRSPPFSRGGAGARLRAYDHVAACTTTKSIYGIGWKPIFCIGSSNRYDLYNTKNEWFIVSVIADRHKKWNFENKKTAELRPRPIGSRCRPCRYSRRHHRRAGRGPTPRPDPCPPSLSFHKRGPPSRDDLRRHWLCLNVKDGGRCSTAVAHLASTAMPPWASVVVTVVTRLTSTVRTEADGGGDPDRGTDGGGDLDGGRWRW
jgi:hypothetical protein